MCRQTTQMMDIVIVRMMVEVLSILGIATEEIKIFEEADGPY